MSNEQKRAKADLLRLELQAELDGDGPTDMAAWNRKRLEADGLLAELEAEQTPPPPVVPNRDNGQLEESEYNAHMADHDRITGGSEYRRSLDKYLRSFVIPETYGHREQDVLQEGVDTLGGFLVPADKVGGVFHVPAAPVSVLDAVARRFTTRDRITITRVVRATGSDEDIYTGANIPTWIAEIPAAAAGEAEPTFGTVEIPISKGRIKTFASRDEVADSEVDLLSVLLATGGPNIRTFINRAVLIGTGVGPEPGGILNDSDLPASLDVEGTTVNTISNTTGDLGSASLIIDMQSALPEQYRPNAVWVMSKATAGAIRKLIDGSGRYLWSAGLEASPATLLGSPVILDPFMSDDGSDGNKVLLYGDLNQAYTLGLREELAVQIDPYSKADVEQIVFYIRFRAGGAVKNPRAVRVGIV